jgi:hypothetical protein
VKRGRLTGMAVGLVACAVAACLAWAAAAPEPLRLGPLEPGERVYLLGISGREHAMLAASPRQLAGLHRSLELGDDVGAEEALRRMWPPTPTGVEVLILEIRGTFAEVRILEGKDRGRKGWVRVDELVRGWGKEK